LDRAGHELLRTGPEAEPSHERSEPSRAEPSHEPSHAPEPSHPEPVHQESLENRPR
jgi:hypothetical protein